MSTYLNACDHKTASIRVRHRVLHLRNYSCEWCQQTLKQACFQEYPEAQFAFKNLMIHIFCNSHYVSHFAAFFIVART